MPDSDADLSQFLLTDQAPSGCCSSTPSKLAWLVETALQCVLQRAAWLYLCAVAQLPSYCRCLPFCTRTWKALAGCAAYLMRWLPGRSLAAACQPCSAPSARLQALTTSASAAGNAQHLYAAARHRAAPAARAGRPLGLVSPDPRTLLRRNCASRVIPICSCLAIIRCHMHPASAAGAAWGVQGSHSWRVESGPPGLWRQAEGWVQLPRASARGVLPPLPAHGGAPVPLCHCRELL